MYNSKLPSLATSSYCSGELWLDSLGTHLLLDLKECNAELLDDVDYVREVVLAAATEAGATVVGETFHKFRPIGVTGIVAIAESHISIHTWPEHSYAAADIFTCGASLTPLRAADLIVKMLECEDASISDVKRGDVLASAPAAI